MKIAIFGKKFQTETETYRKSLRVTLQKYGIKDRFIDESYYATTAEQDEAEPEKIFQKIQKILILADAVIIESTHHSDGIGLISGLCIAYDKPTLVICDSNIRSKAHYSTISTGAGESNLKYWVRGYKNNKFDAVVKEFIDSTNNLINSKFYIILPPEIKRYLDWWSTHFRQAKVEKIRQLLLDDMKRNTEWCKLSS